MASDVSGMTSYTSKERELVKMQAEVNLQEEVTRFAQQRLAMKVLEAEIHSASNRSARSCESMISPVILSPPLKIHKGAKGSGGPPEDDPNGHDEDPEVDSCPSTVYKPSPSPSPSAGEILYTRLGVVRRKPDKALSIRWSSPKREFHPL